MAQHSFRYRSFTIQKDQTFGHGSYGAVYKAKCDQLTCAAKVLHPTIVDSYDPGSEKVLQRFQQECDFLNQIRHPHIVQYLGVCTDPDSNLPVLLMELLDSSLTKMLESSPQPISYHIQVDLCHHIALAIAYLHSNGISHRDLSGNNVLVVAGRRAKVTDFGMSRIVGTQRHLTPLTLCPGTMGYMSPESLIEPPRYTEKLDVFSQGVIMIQVCTRQFPDPGPAIKQVEDSRFPLGVIQVPVSESERRKNHIDLIDPTHPLLSIVLACLEYREKDRPSAEELCQRLANLKENQKYIESSQNTTPATPEVNETLQQERDELARQVEEKSHQLEAKDQQIARKDEELAAKNEELTLQSQQIAAKDQELAKKDQKITVKIEELSTEDHTKDDEIQRLGMQLQELNQRLVDNEQVTGQSQEVNKQLQQQNQDLHQQNKDFKQAIQDLQIQNHDMYLQIQDLQKQKQNLQKQNQNLQNQNQELQDLLKPQDLELYQNLPPPQPQTNELPQLKLQNQDLQGQNQDLQGQNRDLQQQIQDLQITVGTLRRQLKAVSESSAKNDAFQWKDGGEAPFSDSRESSVMVGNVAYFCSDRIVYSYDSSSGKWNTLPECPQEWGSLAIIKGLLTMVGGKISDSISTNKLVSLTDRGKWVEQFPPMPTGRRATTATTYQNRLIIAGGSLTGWVKDYMNTVEVLNTRTLVWSTADSLPHPFAFGSATIVSDRLYMLGGSDRNGQCRSVFSCSLPELLQSCQTLTALQVWQRDADVPVYESTCTTVHGQLVSVGGRDESNKVTSAVYKYNPNTKSWSIISHMPTARCQCYVAAVQNTNRLMVIGGSGDKYYTACIAIAEYQELHVYMTLH